MEIDWAATFKALKGNRTLVDIAVDSALQEFPRLLAAIRQSLADGDAAGLRLAAHTLKGSIRYFGATPAFELAAELERLARCGDFAQASALWTALEPQMTQLTVALAAYKAGQ